MPSGTSFDLKITEKPWMKDGGKAAMRKAIEAGAQGWHDEMQHYPPQAGAFRSNWSGKTFLTSGKRQTSTTLHMAKPYRRTYELRKTATYQVKSPFEAALIGLYYGKYVLLGTKYWAGWPGKLDLIKKRIGLRYKAALRIALGK
jgi:hypothetical protein